MEMEPVQLMNQLAQLTTKSSTEIHATLFMGTAANNMLDCIKNFDHIAAHNVWNNQKELQVIHVYLTDIALNFYCSLPEQTKTDINLLKAALRDRYHMQDRLYDMRVRLHELRQESSLETYLNDFNTLARHLELPEQQKIHYFIFGLKPKLEQALLIRQPQTYDDAVTFAKRKHHFADTYSEAQLIDLLQDILKEVSLKQTGIKQEPYSAPVHNNHTNHLQQNISNLQTDMQSLKNAISTPHTQSAAPLITLQQQLSKMKEDIKHLQQMKRANVYPTPPGHYRSFGTTDGLVICQRCNQVGILHVHSQKIYHLPEHPHIVRTIDATMSLLSPSPPPPPIPTAIVPLQSPLPLRKKSYFPGLGIP